MRSLRILIPALLVAMLGATSGCGIGRTEAEVTRDTRRAFLYDAYMLTDDASLLFQTDRPIRTNRYIVE
ncbi:MAG: hypothetical protein HUU22_03945 [Phycisphaerae bacterium]|nr:hypothetical protein [Phycisphaerae bacterium]NUQ45169.1 hypothetical protein [Phycisphaerae bacterium]